MIGSIDLTAGLVLGAIFALCVVALAAIWLIPRRQARHWANQGIAGRELVDLENDARGTVVQIVGGVALLLTFAATWTQVSDTHTSSDRTLRLTADQQVNERFARAVEQLASKQMEIRIGGVFALEGVADEDSARQAPIAQILLSYLQQHHRASGAIRQEVPLVDRTTTALDPPRCRMDRSQRSADDMHAALSAVLGFAADARPRFKLNNLDLRFFRARNADFREADFSHSYLTTGQLPRARFDRAILMATDFTNTCLNEASFVGAQSIVFGTSFRGADLRGADLSRSTFVSATFDFADLREAKLRHGHLRNATLSGADLRHTDLRDADLHDADLRDADLRDADLNAADLDGADLRGADLSRTGLRQNSAQIASARTDACTVAPWRPRVSPSCPHGDR